MKIVNKMSSPNAMKLSDFKDGDVIYIHDKDIYLMKMYRGFVNLQDGRTWTYGSEDEPFFFGRYTLCNATLIIE